MLAKEHLRLLEDVGGNDRVFIKVGCIRCES
jgi:hypothetical protein